MERAICRLQTALAQAQQGHCFLCKRWCLWTRIRQFLCKTALCVKDGLDAKTSVLFKPRFILNQSMCVNQVLEKAILRTALEKPYLERLVMRVKGVRYKSQWIKYKYWI